MLKFSRALVSSALVVAALGGVAWAEPPTLSSFELLPGDREPGPALGHQERASSAKGDNYTFVVWYEQREIRGARIDGEGNVVDTAPILIARDRLTNASLPRNASRPPRVAWNGAAWVVAFHGDTVSENGGFITSYAYAVRVSPEGVVLDETPIVVRRAEDIDPDSNEYPTNITVAAHPDGTWVVAWSERIATWTRVVRAKRYSQDGQPLTPEPLTLTSTANNAEADFAELSANESGYLLTMKRGTFLADDYDIWGRMFSPAFEPLGTGLFRVGASDPQRYTEAQLASSPEGFVIAAQSTAASLYGFRVPNGSLAPANTSGVLIASGIIDNGWAHEFDVGWDGANWGVSWLIDTNFGFASDIRFRRYSDLLAPVDPAALTIPESPEYGDVQFHFGPHVAELVGGGVKVMWHDNVVPADYNIWGSRVPQGAAPEMRELVSIEARTQALGDVANRPDGSGMVAYWSADAESDKIMVQRFDASGSIIDAEPIELASYEFPTSAGTPAVAFNGSIYMVVWPSGSRAYAVRLTPDGQVLDPAPVAVLPIQETSVVTMLGVDIDAIDDTFLVAGESAQSFNRPYVRYARVRGSDMTVLDPNAPVMEFNINQLGDFSTPVVSTVGTGENRQFVAAFTDYPVAGGSTIDVAFIPVSGPHTLMSFVAPDGSALPTLAPLGDRVLMVYRRESGGTERNLYGRWFNAAAQFDSEEFVIIGAPGAQTNPQLASDGEGFLLAWSDYRHEAGENPLEPSQADIWGARLGADGLSRDGDGFPIHVSPTSEGVPALAAMGPEEFITFFTALTPEFPAVPRIGYRIIGGSGGCPADFNGDDSVTSADITAFLGAWFADLAGGTVVADFDESGTTNSADITAFLSAWFAGVGGEC